MDLARAKAALAATRVLPPGPLPIPETLDELRAVLEDAGGTMLALAVRGTRPAGYGSGMPTPVQDVNEAYGWTEEDMPLPVPSARSISAMDQARGWIALIPLDPPRRGSGLLASPHGGAILRRVVEARSFVNPRSGRNTFSYARLAKLLRCSKAAVAGWHAAGLAIILRELHRRPVGIGHNGGPTW